MTNSLALNLITTAPHDPDAWVRLLRIQCRWPRLVPVRCDAYEPIRRHFEPSAAERLARDVWEAQPPHVKAFLWKAKSPLAGTLGHKYLGTPEYGTLGIYAQWSGDVGETYDFLADYLL